MTEQSYATESCVSLVALSSSFRCHNNFAPRSNLGRVKRVQATPQLSRKGARVLAPPRVHRAAAGIIHAGLSLAAVKCVADAALSLQRDR